MSLLETSTEVFDDTDDVEEGFELVRLDLTSVVATVVGAEVFDASAEVETAAFPVVDASTAALLLYATGAGV